MWPFSDLGAGFLPLSEPFCHHQHPSSPASYLQVFLTASLIPVLPSRSFIPEEQYQGRPSQLLLQAALAHMHYLPEEPGAVGARASSYWQMAQLLQYRAVSVPGPAIWA